MTTIIDPSAEIRACLEGTFSYGVIMGVMECLGRFWQVEIRHEIPIRTGLVLRDPGTGEEIWFWDNIFFFKMKRAWKGILVLQREYFPTVDGVQRRGPTEDVSVLVQIPRIKITYSKEECEILPVVSIKMQIGTKKVLYAQIAILNAIGVGYVDLDDVDDPERSYISCIISRFVQKI